MLKRILAPIVFFLASLPAHAQTNFSGYQWTYHYAGFLEATSNQFYDNYFLTVTFGGTDGNADGMLELSELDVLMIDGRNYASCGVPFDYYFKCEPESFSFIPGEEDSLRLETIWFGNDEAFTSWYGSHSIGDSGITIISGGSNDREEWNSRWVSTNQTVLTITSTVPEPSSAVMFALGFAGIALFRLRRRGT